MQHHKTHWKHLLCIGFAILLCGCETNSSKNYSPTGETVTINNRKIHVRIIGNGKPTLIFFNDIDMYGSFNWIPLQNLTSSTVKSIYYDRNGYYWSDKVKQPRDGEIIAEELEDLLNAKQENGPYILVCHAMGAIYGRIFAGRNIDKIKGIIFIEPSNPDLFDRMEEIGIEKKIPKKSIRPLIWLITNLGIQKSTILKQYSLNDEQYDVAKAYFKKNSMAWFDETVASKESMIEAKKYKTFGDIPLVIMTSGRVHENYTKITKLGIELQKELLTLSSQGKQIIYKDVGHYIQAEKPEIVVSIINEIVNEYK